jgi:hypothetical protein
LFPDVGSDAMKARIWDLHNVEKNKTVIKHRNVRGMKSAVTAGCYSPDGVLFAVGTQSFLWVFSVFLCVCLWERERQCVCLED